MRLLQSAVLWSLCRTCNIYSQQKKVCTFHARREHASFIVMSGASSPSTSRSRASLQSADCTIEPSSLLVFPALSENGQKIFLHVLSKFIVMLNHWTCLITHFAVQAFGACSCPRKAHSSSTCACSRASCSSSSSNGSCSPAKWGYVGRYGPRSPLTPLFCLIR